MPDVKATVKIDTAETDKVIEKANRLVELLQESSTIIGPLFVGAKSFAEATQSYTNNLVIENDKVPYLKSLSNGGFHGDISKC